jgi:hypothetical protein
MYIPKWLELLVSDYENTILHSIYAVAIQHPIDYPGCHGVVCYSTGNGFIHTVDSDVTKRRIIAHFTEEPRPFYFNWHRTPRVS